jgi:hypothetical protein
MCLPFPHRLLLAAGVMAAVTRLAEPAGWAHTALFALTLCMFCFGLGLLGLRRLGKFNSNSPAWSRRLIARPSAPGWLRGTSIAMAALVPSVVVAGHVFHWRPQALGFACGMMVGISLVALRASKRATSLCAFDPTDIGPSVRP